MPGLISTPHTLSFCSCFSFPRVTIGDSLVPSLSPSFSCSFMLVSFESPYFHMLSLASLNLFLSTAAIIIGLEFVLVKLAPATETHFPTLSATKIKWGTF